MRRRFACRASLAGGLISLAVVVVVAPAHGQGKLEGECSGAALESRSAKLPAACAALISNPKTTLQQRAQAYFFRGIWDDWHGHFRNAVNDFDAGLKLDPQHARLNRNRAVMAFKMGDIPLARALINKAIELDPDDAASFVILSDVSNAVNDRHGALAALNRAVEIQPNDFSARQGRADVLVVLGRNEAALADTTWMVSQPPETLKTGRPVYHDGLPTDRVTLAHIMHASVLQQNDRIDEAKRVMGRLVAERPSVVAFLARAKSVIDRPVYVGQDQPWIEALAAADQAIAFDPRIGRAHGHRATALHGLRRHEEALAAINIALPRSLNGHDLSSFLWERARILRSLKRHEDAANSATLAAGYAMQSSRQMLSRIIADLKLRGYWVGSDTPGQMSEDLSDSLTACMLDAVCG